MKKLIVLFLIITQFSIAQNLFERGNQFYQKENYQEAITTYNQILDSGKESAEVYFNLGNCYYKTNKIAPAIYNFEKALLLKPNDAEIKNNLLFAQKRTIDDIKIVRKVGFEKAFSNLTNSFHYDGWAKLAVFFAFLFLVCFAGYYFSQKTLLKRIFFIAMFFVGLFIIISLLSAQFQKNETENSKPAIIFAESTEIKSEPKTTASTVFSAHEGTKVYVLDKVANWKKVRLTDDSTGWIQENAIKLLK